MLETGGTEPLLDKCRSREAINILYRIRRTQDLLQNLISTLDSVRKSLSLRSLPSTMHHGVLSLPYELLGYIIEIACASSNHDTTYARKSEDADWFRGIASDEACTSYRPVLALGSVCRHFREVILSRPSLWSSIEFSGVRDPKPSLDWLEILLARSGEQPLTIKYNHALGSTCVGEFCLKFFLLLVPHCHRWESLTIKGAHANHELGMLLCNLWLPRLKKLNANKSFFVTRLVRKDPSVNIPAVVYPTWKVPNLRTLVCGEYSEFTLLFRGALETLDAEMRSNNEDGLVQFLNLPRFRTIKDLRLRVYNSPDLLSMAMRVHLRVPVVVLSQLHTLKLALISTSSQPNVSPGSPINEGILKRLRTPRLQRLFLFIDLFGNVHHTFKTIIDWFNSQTLSNLQSVHALVDATLTQNPTLRDYTLDQFIRIRATIHKNWSESNGPLPTVEVRYVKDSKEDRLL